MTVGAASGSFGRRLSHCGDSPRYGTIDEPVPESIKNIPPARKTGSRAVDRMTTTSSAAAPL
jgi:hypothetical protein